jgi:glycosyltransferase involved in cell wall biosynthesis
MTALRIGYVLGTTSGGTGRHVAMLAGACLREGFSVSVFGPEETRPLFLTDAAVGSAGGTAGEGDRPAEIRFEPVQITDRLRPARDAAAVLRLRRLLKRADLDVVHAHGLRAGALAALALQPVPLPRWPGGHRPALVVTVHNAAPAAARTAAIYGLLERLVAARADGVLCVSADLSARMLGIGARNVALAVVPAPAITAPPSPAEFGTDGRPVVLAVGRLTGQKGFDTLLAAAARWRDRRPEPLLVIAGDGPLAGELAGQAWKLGVAARFLGDRDDVPALLAAADVFVLPSRWEGQPLILQEALRAARPIVASNVGGVLAVTGPDAALLVPPDEPALLADAVLRILDDRDLAASLAAAALARAAQMPSVADAAQAALAVYGRLAG